MIDGRTDFVSDHPAASASEDASLVLPVLHWRLLFEVDDLSKARRAAEKVRTALGRQADLIVGERYWKDDTLWECSLSMEARGASDAEVVYDCLILATRIANGWYVSGLASDGNLSSFNGIFDRRWSSGSPRFKLHWASFSLAVKN